MTNGPAAITRPCAPGDTGGAGLGLALEFGRYPVMAFESALNSGCRGN